MPNQLLPLALILQEFSILCLHAILHQGLPGILQHS